MRIYEVIVSEIQPNNEKSGACWSEVFNNSAEAQLYMSEVLRQTAEFNDYHTANEPVIISILPIVYDPDITPPELVPTPARIIEVTV